MLRRLASLVVVLAAVAAALSPGSPAARAAEVEHLALRTELEGRRDNDFTGTLTKEQKKQQKAVTKSIALLLPYLEQSIAEHVKAAAKIAKLLQKAYPAEFAIMKASRSLRDLLDALRSRLLIEVGDAADALLAAIPGIHDPKFRAKAEDAHTAAIEELDIAAHAPDIPSAAKALVSAAKFVAKGLAYAAKDPPAETVSATLDIDPSAFDARNVTATYYAASHSVFVNGNTTSGGKFVSMDIDAQLSDPFVPGDYTATAKVYVGTSPVDIATTYYTPSATLHVSALDPVAKTMTASFTFTADTNGNPGPLLVVHAVNGVIDVARLRVE